MRQFGNGEAQWTRTQGICLLQSFTSTRKGSGLGQALPPELLTYRVLLSPTWGTTRYQGLSDPVVPTCLFLLPPFIHHLLCLISPLSTFLSLKNHSCIFFFLSFFFPPLASSLLCSNPPVFSHLKASLAHLFPFFFTFPAVWPICRRELRSTSLGVFLPLVSPSSSVFSVLGFSHV